MISDRLLSLKIFLQLESLLVCSFILSQQFLSVPMSLLIILSGLAPSMETVLGIPLSRVQSAESLLLLAMVLSLIHLLALLESVTITSFPLIIPLL